MATKSAQITVRCSAQEYDWALHAARLKRMTLREYVVRAVNDSLVRDGVDAVLLYENERWPR
jgi:uncharacterized protein (DUF1778 family)